MANDPKAAPAAPPQGAGEAPTPQRDTDDDDRLLVGGGLALLPVLFGRSAASRRRPRSSPSGT
jgi:hypothetical protein